MNAKRPWLFAALLAVAVGVIGWQYAVIADLRQRTGIQQRGKSSTASETTLGEAAVAGDIPLGSTSLEVNKATLTRILADPDSDRLRHHLDAFIHSLDPKSVRALLDAVGIMPKDMRFAYWVKELLLDQWTRSDPAAALAWAQGVSSLRDRSSFLSDVFEAWSETDPQAALAAASQVENLGLRAQFQSEILGNLAKSDPQGALAVLQQLPPNQQRRELMRQFFRPGQTGSRRRRGRHARAAAKRGSILRHGGCGNELGPD